MATFVATAGNDNFQGTAAAADDFYLYLPYADFQHIMNGGGSSASDPPDRLFLSGSMSGNVVPYLQLGFYISNIEQVYLSNSGGQIYLNTDFLNSSATHKVEIFGQGNAADEFRFFFQSGGPLTSQVIFHGGDGDDYWDTGFGFYMGAGGSFEVHGDGGNDTIYGLGWLDGGSGNDTIGTWGSSYVTAGTGDDTVSSSGEYCTLDGGDGTDTLILPYFSGIGSTFSNFEILKVGTARLNASQFNQFSQIQAYDPSSSVGAQFKFYGGGTFNFQTIAVSPWLLTINIDDAAAANYLIVGSAYVNYFTGGAGDDIFVGGDSYNKLNGGEGNDYLVGGAGADELSGWLGYNTLLGGGGNDHLYLGGFNSYPYSPTYCYNAAYGGEGDDLISVSNDLTVYQGGIIDGGIGTDTIYTDGDLSRYTISNVERLYATGPSLHATVAQLNNFQSITAAWITIYVGGSGTLDLGPKLGDPNAAVNLVGETTGDLTLVGTKNNDILQGGQGTSVLYGGDGNDSLFAKEAQGSAATAYLYGGRGGDVLYGGVSSDFLFGDEGNDVIITNAGHLAARGHNYVDGGEGNDWITLNGADDVALGGTGNDWIYSNGTGAYVFGGDGDDFIEILASNATALGGDGNDHIRGGIGNNYLDGGSGIDAIAGSWGNDYMVGGTGVDYFLLNSDANPGDVDLIADFKPGEDWIGLPPDLSRSTYYYDTSYGIDVICVVNGGYYQAFLLGIHDINAVKASLFFYEL
jgi:Ca2+-binding RTX toxin-like protein